VLQHFTNDTIKKFLTPMTDEQPKVPIPTLLVVGALAGVASTLCTYPVEVIKTRITIEVKTTPPNSSDLIAT
jgi:solute carrier family 25 (mitochondrial phosphate transporter), member 23/24/25/41